MKYSAFLFLFYIVTVVFLKGCAHNLEENSEQSCYKATTGELWCLDELDE